MRTDQSIMEMHDGTQRHVTTLILVITGPLLGLAYVLFFPVIGLASCILAVCYRAGRSLATMWHRATQTTVDAQ